MYPRWLRYHQIGLLKNQAHRSPGLQSQIAWLTGRAQLKRLVRGWRPDVVYAQSVFPNGYVAERLQRLTSLPFVIAEHAMAHITDCERYPARRRAWERVVSRASNFIAVSETMAAEMRRLFPDVSTRTVHNGADPVPEANLRKPRPVEIEGKCVILSVGMFYTVKNFPLLIRAFARIAHKHPAAVLRIIGDGEDRAEVQRAIAECKLEDRVRLLGIQPSARVVQEVAWADAFALLSRSEAFGVAFAEAMAGAKPIICTSNCGIVDVVKDGIHGYVVPADDLEAAAKALDHMIGDRDRRLAMGRRSHEAFVDGLSWEANARTMLGLFRDAAVGRKKVY
jgi:glycosyltransferase involved in cell wall biosynthesis